MASNRLITEWLDSAGGFLRAANWVDTGGGLATLMIRAQALSNAGIYLYTSGSPGTPGVAPVGDATWYLTTDTAVFTFRCADNSNVQFVIPAPKSVIMTSGGLIVDPSQADVAAFISAAIGTLSNLVSSDVVGFVSGVKSSRRTEQNAPQG